MKATVTATYHAAELSKKDARIFELEEKLCQLEDIDKVCDHNIAEATRLLSELEEEQEEFRRVSARLAIAEACLRNTEFGYEEYEERLLEERL